MMNVIPIKHSWHKRLFTTVAGLMLLLLAPVGGGSWGSATVLASDYQVTATAARGGQVVPTQRTVRAGATMTFTVQPEAGYRVLDSLVGGNCPRGTWKDNHYTTGAINADCTVSFRFYSSSHVVTAAAPRGGQVDPPNRVVTSGSTGSFNVVPNPGHIISTAVRGDCPSGSWNGNTYTTGMISGNCAVQFEFPRLHSVTATASSGGTLTPARQSVVSGSGTSFTVSPDSGYVPSSTVGGTCPQGSWNGNLYTIGAINRDCTVTIGFSAQRSVTASAGRGGQVTPTNRQVAGGSRASFNLQPDAGYVSLEQVSGNCPGGSWGGNTYTTGIITDNCAIDFAFSPLVSNVTVSAVAGAGGGVSPAVQVVNRGNRAEFTVNPQSGYSVDRSAGGTCAVGSWSGNRYSTGDVHSDCHVSFSFVSARYTVNATVDGGGQVAPMRQTIADGGNASFRVQADVGHRINSAIGGSCAGGGWSGDRYTTGPIRDHCTVRFSTIGEEHTVTANTGFGGTVTTAIRSVTSGATASFTVVPDFGYARSVTVDGDCPQGTWIGNAYSTGEVTKSCSVEFSFHYIH
ncbi:InlB B-repeat-containing protein [Pelovirga terrestris]|uniref:Bacterial repeat domain-containing protein n=1 Tax=Pelovirga terrestris TaxID=2771352 RepID=A0A8J6UI99_9BACT|nr:hypothetical protein [Pelovirga terrestris]MBD1400455.1 hypothetical protein [Pelovirga terrestris]